MALKAGILIDKLYAQDVAIDKIEAALRKEKQKREAIQDKLLNAFSSQKLDGAAGRTARAAIRKSRHPSVANRPKFMKYVIKNKAWDLLENRVAKKAFFDREDDGEYVPGVKIFEKVRVSVTKTRK
jgi:hypothetical protein